MGKRYQIKDVCKYEMMIFIGIHECNNGITNTVSSSNSNMDITEAALGNQNIIRNNDEDYGIISEWFQYYGNKVRKTKSGREIKISNRLQI